MSGSEQACLRQWRAKLVAELSGEVLEIGAGTGASPELHPAAVTRLTLAEPDPHMRRRLAARCRDSDGRFVVSDASAAQSRSPKRLDPVVVR